MKVRQFTILMLTLMSSLRVSAKLALVYKGAGSCPQTVDKKGKISTGCSEAAAAIARRLGYDIQYVEPKNLLSESYWTKADIWIQPGGEAKDQIRAMSPALQIKIRDFVRAGRGYVGFCAGGFLAGEKFGWKRAYGEKRAFESKALGLIPGYVHYFDALDSGLTSKSLARILEFDWAGTRRSLYWELGPYFEAPPPGGPVEAVGYYLDGAGKPRVNRVMSLKSTYGKGRVWVTAIHPEAPEDWREFYKIKDKDGLDLDLAEQMMKWVTSPETLSQN